MESNERAEAPAPLVHRVNGYTITWDAWGRSWGISKRGNLKTLGIKDLAGAVRWAEAH